MALRDKLKTINRQQQVYKKPESKSSNNCLEKDDITDRLGGTEIKNAGGTILQKKYIFPLSHQHGRYYFQEIHKPNIESVHYLLSSRQKFTCDDLLFIDTETTGLGGVGTTVFLVGLGYIADNNFIIKQFLMRDLDEELALLTAINKIFVRHSLLVSFNGKCFDIPVLNNRFILNRLERSQFKDHLDLLHPARCIWSYLDSCSLNNLEQQVLGIDRCYDVPGSKVPSYYFKYLKEGNPKYLQPILHHNLIDIKSLVSLLILLKQIYTIDFKIELSARELYNLARYQEREKLLYISIENYEKAYGKADDEFLKSDIEQRLSWQYKRAENWGQAAAIWEKMIKADRGRLFPYIELAKYYEHKEKNYQLALNYTKTALAFFKKNRVLIKNWRQRRQELLHRRQRLQHKLD